MLTSGKMLALIDEALEESSRWPRLLQALGFDMSVGRPGPPLLNAALAKRGFRRIVDEHDSVRLMFSEYPDAWWFAIAQEVSGRPDATAQEVVEAINSRVLEHAAQ